MVADLAGMRRPRINSPRRRPFPLIQVNATRWLRERIVVLGGARRDGEE